MATFSFLAIKPAPLILHKVVRPLLHLCCLIPFIQLLFNAYSNTLGVNPVETLTHTTGEWSLRFLLLSLSITPLIRFTSNNWLIVFRRPLGLYCFFYALLHFLVYWVFDQGLSFAYLIEDIIDRPYITIGSLGFILLIPLTITSTKAMRKKMRQNWNKLHKLSYFIAFCAIIHLIWLTKADYREAWIYTSIFLVLMALRIPKEIKHKRSRERIPLSE